MPEIPVPLNKIQKNALTKLDYGILNVYIHIIKFIHGIERKRKQMP